MEKVVLAYSGGLDTSIIIPWIKENYELEVIAVCVDVGQDDDLSKIEEKAKLSGASKAYVIDVKNEFVEKFAFRGLKALAVYEEKYLLGTAYARPLIARELVKVAQKEGAKYICHGCTGKGNDQVRFETGIAALDPSIKIIAPWREWDIVSREQAIDYANERNIPLTVTKEKIYSRDHNLWHISHEGGHIEYLENEHQADELYLMTKTLEKASDTPEYVEIEFVEGYPKKVNGESLNGEKLLTLLNKMGGKHAIGVTDIVENRVVGMKSRGIYETPGGTILMEALKELESICLDAKSLAYKKHMSISYAEILYQGLWFSPLKEAMDCFIDKLHQNCSGVIKLKLYKGNVLPATRSAKQCLYMDEISTFGESELYNHADADGFIKLFSLSSKIINMSKKG